MPGRKVMTCCADDTQFVGYISFMIILHHLKINSGLLLLQQSNLSFKWLTRKKGPVLYVSKVVEAEAPKEELVYF